MKTIDTVNFSGKKALLRVDFNVPLDSSYKISDQTRLRAAIATIRKILNDGGSVVLISHLGRPKKGYEQKFSLVHLVARLSQLLGVEVQFGGDCIGSLAFEKSAKLAAGEVLLLDNLRFHEGEKKGDITFAQRLAQHGDIYVNDAFGTAHRAHASTAVIAQFFREKVSGYIMQRELDNAQKVLDHAERPFTAIMGGAKISDKILIIEKLLDKVDNLIIGGGMSYTFFKAMGGAIGNSLVELGKIDLANELVAKAREKGVNLLLPQDSIVAHDFNNEARRKIVDSITIPDGYMGLDIGEKAAADFSAVIRRSKTVLWNGPMGVFEMPNFAYGTIAIAKAVVSATQAGGFSLVGGGDSAAAINTLGFGDAVSYISTGGGALLTYMEGKTLPGLAALA